MPMGVLCTLTEDEGAKAGASERYNDMLADLAKRAEIRDRMVSAPNHGPGAVAVSKAIAHDSREKVEI